MVQDTPTGTTPPPAKKTTPASTSTRVKKANASLASADPTTPRTRPTASKPVTAKAPEPAEAPQVEPEAPQAEPEAQRAEPEGPQAEPAPQTAEAPQSEPEAAADGSAAGEIATDESTTDDGAEDGAGESTVETDETILLYRRPPTLRALKRAPAPIHPPEGQGELFATEMSARPAPVHSELPTKPPRKPAPQPQQQVTQAQPPQRPAAPEPEFAAPARTHRLENAAERAIRTVLRSGGPQAADWVARARDRYPRATPEALARLAVLHFENRIRRDGLISGSGGAVGAVLGVCDLARTQAQLVLHVAAAYGLDPCAPQRHADVVALLRVPRFTEPDLTPARDAGRFLGGYALRRAAAKLIPFGGSLAGAALARRETADLAARAAQRYRSRLQLWNQM